MTHLPVLTPAPFLAALIHACQKMCVAECCGLDAFDFSPLHIASHLSAYTGTVQDADLARLRDELGLLLHAGATLAPDAHGFICSVAGTNQNFSRAALADLVASINRGLTLAPQVLAYSDSLQRMDAGLER